MRKIVKSAFTLATSAVLFLFISCDDKWEEGGDFNTSQGAGININFSGVYQARTAGAALVPEGDEAAITRLIITQIGNTIEVRDDYNKLYTGYIGSPGVMAPSSSGSYPAGATMLQAQINFTNNKNVDFIGTIRAVAVTDITSRDTSTTQTGTQSTNITVTVSETIGGETTEVEIENSSATDSTITDSHTYSVTEANTQYILEGNWVRYHFDDVILIEAIAPAVAGTF